MARLSITRVRGRAIQGLSLAVAVVALTAAAGRTALAVVPFPTGFNVDVSPSARILDALDMNRDGLISTQMYHDIIYDESCDNPLLRIQARNHPAIMVTNHIDGVTASAAPITSFTMHIDDTAISPVNPYIFGTGDAMGINFMGLAAKNTIYTDPGVSITSSTISPDGKTLTVNFDGMTDDKKAIFYIDLDTTNPGGFMYPDYRMVLFGAPEPGQSPTNPADVSATFTSPTLPPNTKVMTLSFTQETTTPEFSETNVREYHEEDKMEVTSIGTAIPEPSALLLSLGSVVLLAGRVRKGSRAA